MSAKPETFQSQFIKDLLAADPKRTFELVSSVSSATFNEIRNSLPDDQEVEITHKYLVGRLNAALIEEQKQKEAPKQSAQDKSKAATAGNHANYSRRIRRVVES